MRAVLAGLHDDAHVLVDAGAPVLDDLPVFEEQETDEGEVSPPPP